MVIKRHGILFILSSPSGAGKSTIAKHILSECDNIQISVSATTRKARPSEIEGVEYYFKSKETFQKMIENKEFIEYAKIFEHYYGTPIAPITKGLKEGKDILFDIDWQGTQALMDSFAKDLVTIFILPPSTKELEKRLYKRAQDSKEVVTKRMAKFTDEVSHYAEYDWVIINDNFNESVASVKAIIQSERLKRTRQVNLHTFVQKLVQER